MYSYRKQHFIHTSIIVVTFLIGKYTAESKYKSSVISCFFWHWDYVFKPEAMHKVVVALQKAFLCLGLEWVKNPHSYLYSVLKD